MEFKKEHVRKWAGVTMRVSTIARVAYHHQPLLKLALHYVSSIIGRVAIGQFAHKVAHKQGHAIKLQTAKAAYLHPPQVNHALIFLLASRFIIPTGLGVGRTEHRQEI